MTDFDTHHRYRRSDPDTSREAAEHIDSERLRILHQEVINFFCTVPNATQLDLENFYNDHRSTYRSRVPELVEKGWLYYTGGKRLQNGRMRRVYALTSKKEKTMNAPTPAPKTIDQRVDQYVQIRDKIRDMEKAHDEAIKPYKDALEGLNGLLLNHLNSLGVESARTNSGTVYATRRTSASVADPNAFWDYILESKQYELIDKRANKTAVTDFVTVTGNPPPGVNFSVTQVVGVRRS